MKLKKGIKTFRGVNKRKTPVLPELNSVVNLFEKRAALHRESRHLENKLENKLGKKLAPILDAAERAGNWQRVILMAQSIEASGSCLARFFYEAAYRMQNKGA